MVKIETVPIDKPRKQTRHHLASRENDTSFSHWKMRRCLVHAQEHEASPCSPIRRQGSASSAGVEMRRCLIPARGDAQYRSIAGGPCTGILSGRYVPPILGDTDQNREPCLEL
ncbi:hypothetical protein GW17_00016028 [Ensete ventricosum]|nr:hypothetical protein GW17_00016028 [Ensete ventricosum]